MQQKQARRRLLSAEPDVKIRVTPIDRNIDKKGTDCPLPFVSFNGDHLKSYYPLSLVIKRSTLSSIIIRRGVPRVTKLTVNRYNDFYKTDYHAPGDTRGEKEKRCAFKVFPLAKDPLLIGGEESNGGRKLLIGGGGSGDKSKKKKRVRLNTDLIRIASRRGSGRSSRRTREADDASGRSDTDGADDEPASRATTIMPSSRNVDYEDRVRLFYCDDEGQPLVPVRTAGNINSDYTYAFQVIDGRKFGEKRIGSEDGNDIL